MNEFDKNSLNYLEKKALQNINTMDEKLYHSVTQLKESLNRLEEIESADGGEAMEALERLSHNSTRDIKDFRLLDKFILKSQQQARELEEIKRTAIWALKQSIYINDCLPHPSASDDFVFKRELKKLVGENDE